MSKETKRRELDRLFHKLTTTMRPKDYAPPRRIRKYRGSQKDRAFFERVATL